ncbi:ankyrin repeat domain-containing protein [Imbroritus primus]|uniref:ankyrin repeat domain-containing protein n=1 Tax=Imbroritus primus TaxID=3058603 RepID=UPI003D161651
MPDKIAPLAFPPAARSAAREHGTSQPGPPATPTVSPATLVVRDRNLARLISDYASPGTRSMPVGTRWCLDTARKAAIWRGIHPNFTKHHAAYADQALARLEHGQLTEQELLSEFMLRLARARLPAKYPESEGKRAQLTQQMTEGMRKYFNGVGPYIDPLFRITLLLDAAYGTLSPAPTENTSGDPAWAQAILQADTLRYCLHTFLCDLATGTHDLGRLETLARHCASQTGRGRRFWYAKLAFFAAHFGAWRSVRLLLDAGKLRPDKLGERYDIDESRIYARLRGRTRECLIEEMPPGKGEDHIGLLHLAAAQDEVDMLPFLVAHLTSAGMSIDYGNDEAETALCHALWHGKARAATWLVENNADINACDIRGNPALHLAAMTSPDMVRVMLAAKADVHALDLDQQSALAVTTHPESVTLLCEAGADWANPDVDACDPGTNQLFRWINHPEGPRVDLVAAVHETCTTPEQHARFLTLLNPPPGGKDAPLLSYLRRSPVRGWNRPDSRAFLQALDETIATVRAFRAWGADPHWRNGNGPSAVDLAHGFQDRVREIYWHRAARGIPAPLEARIDALINALEGIEMDIDAPAHSGKRKRTDTE